MNKSRERNLQLITFALSGAVTGLSVCFSESIGALVFISMVPALLLLLSLLDRGTISLKAVYGYGLVYYECFFAVCFHWFAYMYPMTFTGIDNFTSVLVILVAILGLSLLQALGSALTFLFAAALVKMRAASHIKEAGMFLFPAAYTAAEFLQTFGWWGVPWGRLSLGAAYDSALLGSASFFGSYFITYTIVIVNLGIAFTIYFAKKRNVKFAKLLAGVAIFAFSFNLVLGTFSHGIASRKYESSEKITVAAIQGNYSSTAVSKPSGDKIVSTYIELSEKAAAEGAKFILWPESALNFVVETNDYIAYRIAALAKRCGVYVMVGTLTRDDEGELYNCMFLATPDGDFSETVYYKRHLVPFGEYVPMRDLICTLLPFLEDVRLLNEDMVPGDGTEIYDIPQIGKVGAIICFDSIYESLSRDTVLDGAEFLALGTNDSWFSDSAAIYMHNNQARLRAIEFGRCVLRAANTGTSTVITPAGDVLGYTEPLIETYIMGEISLSSDRTLYSYIGNLFAYCCLASCFSGLCLIMITKQRKKTNG